MSDHALRRPLVVATVLLALALASPANGADRPPNLLFIFADDLTCQALSCYGESRHLLDTTSTAWRARGCGSTAAW